MSDQSWDLFDSLSPDEKAKVLAITDWFAGRGQTLLFSGIVGRAYAQVSPVIGGEVGVFVDYSMLSAAQNAQAHFADTDAPSGVEVKLDLASATSSAQLDLSVGQPAEQIQGLRMLGFQILWEWTDGDPRAHIARAVDSTNQLIDISVAYDPQDALLDIAERLLPRSDL
jgi:hypothetical protein